MVVSVQSSHNYRSGLELELTSGNEITASVATTMISGSPFVTPSACAACAISRTIHRLFVLRGTRNGADSANVLRECLHEATKHTCVCTPKPTQRPTGEGLTDRGSTYRTSIVA